MTQKEILEKAIQKAINGGYRHASMEDSANPEVFVYADSSMVNFAYHINNRIYYIGGNAEPTNNLIFNHDFAKALWGEVVIGNGEDEIDIDEYFTLINSQKEWSGYNWGGPHFKGPLWKFHLQQMVIADDPIAYLGENI